MKKAHCIGPPFLKNIHNEDRIKHLPRRERHIMKMQDHDRFQKACAQAAEGLRGQKGIGTLGEKTLHAALKAYYEPDAESHEIKIGRYVADIVGEDGIIEIQTRAFDKLRKKLEAFLSVAHVTVVYPVAAVKWLLWIDPDTGELSKPRRSPRKGVAQDAFTELYKIRPLLSHPNLTIRIVLLEIKEYRCRNGWSKDGKKGSTRCDRVPSALLQEIILDAPAAYRQLVPNGLSAPFTAKEYQKAVKISLPKARTVLLLLYELGVVHRVGKIGNAFLYEPVEAT